MAAGTWAGHLWRGLTAEEEEREVASPEEYQEGLGFPHLLHNGREHTSSPCKGAKSEVELQSLPGSRLDKLLLSVGTGMVGNSLRY